MATLWLEKKLDTDNSTVLCTSWHPTLPLIAVGSADCTVRVFDEQVRGRISGCPIQGPLSLLLPMLTPHFFTGFYTSGRWNNKTNFGCFMSCLASRISHFGHGLVRWLCLNANSLGWQNKGRYGRASVIYYRFAVLLHGPTPCIW